MIRITNLSYAYEKSDVIQNISFEVGEKNLFALFGPNGSGKTTLIKCIAGLLKFENGAISIKGENIKNWRIKELARTIAYVPQEHKPFFPYLVKEVVLMGRTPYIGDLGFGPAKKDINEASRAMDLIGITDLAEKPYTNLSGGERQLVMIARAVAQKPKILLLDEPTLNLDFKNQLKIWELIRSLISRENLTVLVSTHDPNHVLWYCENVILMDKGKTIGIGKSSELLTKENLEKLYGTICDVKKIDGKNFVVPSN